MSSERLICLDPQTARALLVEVVVMYDNVNVCELKERGSTPEFRALVARIESLLNGSEKSEAIGTDLSAYRATLAERDQKIAALERHVETSGKIMNDLLVGNQAAWIEWRHGKGAEEAMVWLEGSLYGVGVPEEDEPWAKEAQAWYGANKADPFPACFCGRPSNHLWMGQGFCSDAHYDAGRAKADAEAAGATGMPLFDGTSPDTEGGGCD